MKIIFIINSAGDPHSYKRVNDFNANGFDVEVYSFQRTAFLPDPSINEKIIGHLEDGKHYIKKQFSIAKGLYPVFKKYKNENVAYYFFGLIIAQIAVLFTSKPYIYEESDMTHLSFNKALSALLECVNKRIIRKSFETIFTSEGFLKYHYGNMILENTTIMANKLNPNIKQFKYVGRKIDTKSFAFIGLIRYQTIYQFAKIIGEYFPEKFFHFWGVFANSDEEKRFENLISYENIFFHGKFNGYNDLADIYSQVDILVVTYDVAFKNTIFAEPNKLYEAIYFEKPIIVSKETFLEEKVKKLGVGYSVNTYDINECIEFVKNLTRDDLEQKVKNCRDIPKHYCFNDNSLFVTKIKQKLLKFQTF